MSLENWVNQTSTESQANNKPRIEEKESLNALFRNVQSNVNTNTSEKSYLKTQFNGITSAMSMLLPWSHFLDQTIANISGITKPNDILIHWKDAKL